MNKPNPLKRWLLAVMLLTAVMPAAQAVPLADDALPGTVSLGGTERVNLTFNLVGSQELLTRYTIGVFDLNRISADVNDPDFQIQALQSNCVTLLHEVGRPLESSYALTVNGDARLGLFILRDGTLRDFSLGRNFYRPIFSLPGAPGGYLVENDQQPEFGQIVFDFNSPSLGRVFATGSGGQSSAQGFQVIVSGFDRQQEDPVVPEPATLAMVGLGLGTAGLLRRRRGVSRKSAKA